MNKLNNVKWGDIKLVKFKEPSQFNVNTTHMNLSTGMITQYFKRLCPGLADLDHHAWIEIFSQSMHTRDSFKRNTHQFQPVRNDVIYRDMMKFLRSSVFGAARLHVHSKYATKTALTHTGMPILLPENYMAAFKKKHGRDLKAELEVNEYGLSKVACLYPTCPFFALPLGKARICCKQKCMNQRLKEHLSCSIPAFHKIVFQNPRKTVHEIINLILENEPLARISRQRVGEIIRYVEQIQTPIPWEKFEAYFHCPKSRAAPSQHARFS
jgi:hypothetical protein